MQGFTKFNRVLSMLGYLTKCPVTDDKTPVVNSLNR